MDADAIVRSLAGREPIAFDPVRGTSICALCRQSPEIEVDPVLHLDDCPWQLAYDWVDEQETPLS